MMKYIATALLSLAAVSAQAGDASTYQTLGFSKDGKYFAFAETGTQDGSGFHYANVAVVDVAKNKFAAAKNVVLEGEGDESTGSPEEALTKAVAELKLGRFGITRGANLGQELLVRLPTDYSTYSGNTFSIDYWAEGGASTTVPKYDVVIETSAGEDTSEGKWCSEFRGSAPELLKLSVVGKEGNGTEGFAQLLQQDKSLPKSRSCAGSYGVQRVIKKGNSLVIVLSFSEPGFEGPDVRHMVVTGKVDFPNEN